MAALTGEQAVALYTAVQGRPRPEDVADLVLRVLDGELSGEESVTLRRAARHSLRANAVSYTSMAQDFARPVTQVGRQIKVAAVLFETPELSLADGIDAGRVLNYVRWVGVRVGKVAGKNDFRTDRLATKAARRAVGIWKNARWYNRRWRLLKRIEEKIAKLAWNERKYAAVRVGKGGLASRLSRADLAADANSACFVAYLSARMGLRSAFTNKAQVRAFDTVAELLLVRCERSATTRWDVIASSAADARVLARLDDGRRGALLGQWWGVLTDLAGMLERVAEGAAMDRAAMVVSSGNDSTTWNQVALAWNEARAQWVSLLYVMGFESLLDRLCPGKVMRLMAADVAYWHRASGGDVHPDTKVWAALPPPWEVLCGTARCGRAEVEAACAAAGVKPETWTGPKGNREAVAFTLTPELVHGVAVANPEMARTLRRLGVFSGKRLRGEIPDDVVIVRDEHGAAVRVEETSVAQDQSGRLVSGRTGRENPPGG